MSRWHAASALAGGRYVLTVRAPDGTVLRRRAHGTCGEAGASPDAPGLAELIAGRSGEVRRGGSLCWSFEPVNPKVGALVGSLRAAGIPTAGSGDLYSDDLVYVDLAARWAAAAAAADLPPGWVVTANLAAAARGGLGLPPPPPPGGEPVEGVVGDPAEARPETRLSRRGGAVPPREAEAVASALLEAAAGDPELRLECLCADDFGAGYKGESERTGDDDARIERYEETRAAQLAMARDAEARGIEHLVADSDDRDSRHSDAYVYFPPSRLAEVVGVLEAAGLPGDVLDVPPGFPRAEAERIGREHGWAVEFDRAASRYHSASAALAGYYGQQRGYWTALWVSPSGEVHDVEDTHHAWVWDNRELLRGEGVDLEEWYGERVDEAEADALEEARADLVRERAWDAGVDESEVELSEEDEDAISESARESAHGSVDRGLGLALVDLLIDRGWIRVAQKTAIHFEGREGPRLHDRCEAVLAERFPDVWSRSGRGIVVNDEEVDSSDLQEHGGLRAAIEAEARHNRLLTMRR